jgi:lipoprotein-anchoring transpeptidase ErfK/SrfK
MKLVAPSKERMRIASPTRWSVVLGASAAIFAVSADSVGAQYYPRYDRFDRYDRFERYDRYDNYYDRRTYRRYSPDDFIVREPVRERKPKHKPVEPKQAEKNEHPTKGPYQIVVEIGKQRIFLYGADGLIRESRVSTGMRGHSTPTGVFSVIEKDYYHRSNIYSGAPMPLMQRITWSGVALHEGALPGYPASHGCIRLTGEFAKFLWNTTKVGARVIIVHNETAPPAPIASEKLFAPVKKPEEAVSAATSLAKDVIKNDALLLPASAPAAALATISSDQPMETAPMEAVVNASTSGRPAYKAPVMPAKKGPVTVFISRKTGKLYVRYAYAPLFETPIEIKDREKPIGTHVYTAMEPADDGKMQWTSFSIPTPAVAPESAGRKKSTRNQVADIAEKTVINDAEPQTAAAALDRVAIPQDVMERVGELLTPGSSLTISDYGISEETGLATDFIILTRQ